MSKLRKSILAAVAIATAAPAGAGEITGNGKPTGMWGHATSECAFSGYNDMDGNPLDPGFISQSYGQNVRLTDLDPSMLDPNDPDADFVPIPGFACNPNRGQEGPFYPE